MLYETKYENIADGKRSLRNPQLAKGAEASTRKSNACFTLFTPGMIFRGYYLFVRGNDEVKPFLTNGRLYFISRKAEQGVWICDMTSNKAGKDVSDSLIAQEKKNNQERRRRWQDFCYYPLSNTSKSSPNSRHSRLGRSNVLDENGFV